MKTFAGDKSKANRLRGFTALLTPGVSRRPTGRVTYYNDDRGFGFIRSEGYDRDLFVHFTQIKGTLDRRLVRGQEVEFDVVETEKGLEAERVVILSERYASS